MKLFKAILLIFILTINIVQAELYDYIPTVESYVTGDVINLPNRKGNYIFLNWEGTTIYWDETIRWFSPLPVRNYQSVSIPIPEGIEGRFYILEAATQEELETLDDWKTWEAVRGFPVRIKNCVNLTICN